MVTTNRPERPRKRIALLLSSLHGRGVQRVRLTLARAFVSIGLEVDLVVADYSGAMEPDIPPGVNIYRLDARRMAFAVVKMARYFRERKPDAVLSAQDHVNVAAILARMLSRQRFELATSMHVMPADDANRPILTRAHWMPYVIRLLYPFSDQVIAVSQDIASDLEDVSGFPRRNVLVVHNPVDVEHVRKLGAEPLSHPWFADSDAPVIIGVGALGAKKNFSVLIDAVVAVRKTRPVRLVLLGEGPYRARLEKQIVDNDAADYIELAGYVTNPAAYMARAAMLGLTSTSEAFGNVLTEAFACGCPVVSIDCHGGPSEILANGRFGELVDGYDPEDYAAAICRTLDRPRDVDRLLNRAREFDVKIVAEKYLRILKLAD